MYCVGMTCFNNVSYTKETLSCLAFTGTLPYDLVLVDNGSTSCNRIMIQEYCKLNFIPEASKRGLRRFIWSPSNPDSKWTRQKKIGTVRNKLLKMSKGYRYLVMGDNDVYLTPGWMEHAAAVFTTFPEVVLLNPSRRIAPSHKTLRSVERYGIVVRVMGTLAGDWMILNWARWIEVGKPAYPEEPGNYSQPEFSYYKGVDVGFCNRILDQGGWLVAPLSNRIRPNWQPRVYK